MSNAVWLSVKDGVPARGYWDQQLIGDIVVDLPDSERQLFIIPGAYQDDYRSINAEINKFEKVLVVITSDEESKFNTQKLLHNDMIIYSTYAVRGKNENVDYWLPLGYTPHTRQTLKRLGLPRKELDWFFSGQVTHKSRFELVEQLKAIKKRKGKLKETSGFSQGMTSETYTKQMWYAKTVPSPAGAVKADAFRTYEALEAGAIPLPENVEYHKMVFENQPFIIQDNWDNIADYITNYADRYPKLHNEVFAWWQLEKWKIKQRFRKDLGIQEKLTVIIPTSPIPSHPSTKIIDETISTIRSKLDADIIITIDGVREEQQNKDKDYQEYIRKLLWKCNFEYKNVTPVLFTEHMHQAAMMREALNLVTSPVVMYAEHDTPITPDMNFAWEGMYKIIESGNANLIRFHYEGKIHPEHKHMMLDEKPIQMQGVDIIRTVQWSQRPHLASADYYRRILNDYFSDNARTMIEDVMHGVVYGDYKAQGKAGWNKHKLVIYTPGNNIKRSYHTDGRANDEKYDDRYIR